MRIEERASLEFARGWLLAAEMTAGRSWELWLGPLIRARVVRLENERYGASVETFNVQPQAEFSSLLEA